MPTPKDEEARARLEEALYQRRLHYLRIREIDPLKNDRNSVEFFLMVMVMIAGIRLFIDPPPIPPEVGDYWRYAWRVLLIAGSFGVMSGLVWTGRSQTAYLLQQISYLALGFGALAFGTASQSFVVIGFAIACLIRSVQIDMRISEVNPGENIFHFANLPWSRRNGDG